MCGEQVFSGEKYASPLLPASMPAHIYHAIRSSLRIRSASHARDFPLLDGYYKQASPFTGAPKSSSKGTGSAPLSPAAKAGVGVGGVGAAEPDYVLMDPLTEFNLRKLDPVPVPVPVNAPISPQATQATTSSSTDSEVCIHLISVVCFSLSVSLVNTRRTTNNFQAILLFPKNFGLAIFIITFLNFQFLFLLLFS